MRQMPEIQEHMTPMPHTIGNDIPLKTAMEMMREHRIRHLPVQAGGRLVGVLTDRDVKLGAAFADARTLKVEEVMTPDPYTVSPDVPLGRVVGEMAEHKYGCAIVQQDNGKVIGILTAVDALRILADLLGRTYRASPSTVSGGKP